MRTTLNIDNDVLFAVKNLARRQKRTVGEVISDLARQSLTRTPAGSKERRSTSFCGFRPLPRRGGVVSNELINRLRERDIY